MRSFVAIMLVVLALLKTAYADKKESQRVESARGAEDPSGPVVTISGTYEVDPVPQGKRFQGAWLLPDGTANRLVLSYRPQPEHFAFIGKHVVATGRRRVLPPHVQQIRADHFDLLSIALAPGEKPYATAPAKIPAPPLVTTKEKLAAVDGKWARIYGRVVTLDVSPHESHYVLKLVVAMPDGHLLKIHDAYLNLQWDKTQATDAITIIGRASLEPVAAGMVPDIGFSAVCQGHIERCGMLQ